VVYYIGLWIYTVCGILYNNVYIYFKKNQFYKIDFIMPIKYLNIYTYTVYCKWSSVPFPGYVPTIRHWMKTTIIRLFYYCRNWWNKEESSLDLTLPLTTQIQKIGTVLHHIVNKYNSNLTLTAPSINNIPNNERELSVKRHRRQKVDRNIIYKEIRRHEPKYIHM
jgi:hypothetical protein